jgi:hypothetical protein
MISVKILVMFVVTKKVTSINGLVYCSKKYGSVRWIINFGCVVFEHINDFTLLLDIIVLVCFLECKILFLIVYSFV